MGSSTPKVVIFRRNQLHLGTMKDKHTPRTPKSPRGTLSSSDAGPNIKWGSTIPNMCKPPRCFHSSCAIDNQLFFYGGITSQGDILSELCSVSMVNDQWKVHVPLNANNAPPPLYHHTAVYFGGKMFIFGGKTADGSVNSSMFSYTIGTTNSFFGQGHSSYSPQFLRICYLDTSSQALVSFILKIHIHLTIAPLQRFILHPSRKAAKVGHSCCVFGDGILIFGGYTAKDEMSNSLCFYDIGKEEEFELLHGLFCD
jgi:hypothetical protein